MTQQATPPRRKAGLPGEWIRAHAGGLHLRRRVERILVAARQDEDLTDPPDIPEPIKPDIAELRRTMLASARGRKTERAGQSLAHRLISGALITLVACAAVMVSTRSLDLLPQWRAAATAGEINREDGRRLAAVPLSGPVSGPATELAAGPVTVPPANGKTDLVDPMPTASIRIAAPVLPRIDPVHICLLFKKAGLIDADWQPDEARKEEWSCMSGRNADGSLPHNGIFTSVSGPDRSTLSFVRLKLNLTPGIDADKARDTVATAFADLMKAIGDPLPDDAVNGIRAAKDFSYSDNYFSLRVRPEHQDPRRVNVFLQPLHFFKTASTLYPPASNAAEPPLPATGGTRRSTAK